jgi:LytR cell envelope-related transcriptional attenuator
VTAPRGGDSSRVPGTSPGARGAIVVGLAVILGIVGLQILDDSGPSTSVATVTSTAPTTGRPGSSSTTSGLRQAAQVRVKVYNASGVEGRAQILTDQLKSIGYNMQTPANLTKERAGTVVECVKGFDREGALLALNGVPNGAQVQPYPSNPPPGASDADCLVIIGNA